VLQVGFVLEVYVVQLWLKSYSPRLAPTLIEVYEPVFQLQHDNIVEVYGICWPHCHGVLPESSQRM